MNFVTWIEALFGPYSPQMTKVWLPVEAVDPLTGSVYISNYISQEVVASGLASLDVVYILEVVALLGFCVFIVRYLRYALTSKLT